MTIQQLQYILEVNRTGSISAAADSLFVAQPNVSNAIRSLEHELGFPVFVRSRKGVKATEQGLVVLSYAAQIMENVAKMHDINSRSQENRLRIGGLKYSTISEAYVQLCTEYQDVSNLAFSYSTELSIEHMLDQVYLSMLDIGVFMLHPQNISETEALCKQRKLHLIKLHDIPVVLRIGPKHPLYNQPEIQLSDFRNYTFVDYNNRLYTYFPNLSSFLTVHPGRVVFTSDQTTKNILVSQSTMYTLGSKLTAESNDRYRFRCIPLGDLHYTLFAVEQEQRKRSEAANRFLEILSAKLEAL